DELTRAGLPQDLVYVAMVESGFRPDAVSHAAAMGLWQFIAPTGRRYGLAVDWWIDERRDVLKSTRAAIAYMGDLYEQFNSWYLVAASYNMGETRVRKLIARHRTNDFWSLADQGVLPRETTDYVPKIIAAMLISKAPALYGFRDLEYQMPLSFETTRVPGGTDLVNLAGYLGVSEKYLQELNPELIKGFVPREVRGHTIRIPKGATTMVAQFIREQTRTAAN
ncbi:MAG: lytic transglycosylase domain-containing protein, partial [Bdellovibrionota bacterium]